MKRTIVSKTLKTSKGEDVRAEQDSADHIFRTCTGCKSEQYHAGMAAALSDVAEHAKSCSK